MTGPVETERRGQYPLLRLVVAFSSWALSWLEEKEDGKRRLSGFRMVLALFAVTFVKHWPAEWNGPGVAALAVIVFGLPVRDLFRAVPVSEALAALRVFFENTMGKAASAVSRASEFVSTRLGGAEYGGPSPGYERPPEEPTDDKPDREREDDEP